jgi:hypothetical protein
VPTHQNQRWIMLSIIQGIHRLQQAIGDFPGQFSSYFVQSTRIRRS